MQSLELAPVHGQWLLRTLQAALQLRHLVARLHQSAAAAQCIASQHHAASPTCWSPTAPLLHRNLGASLQQKRDYLTRELSALGFKVVPNHGTYFLLADIRPLLPPGSAESDVDFAKRLTVEGGVTTIPVRMA